MKALWNLLIFYPFLNLLLVLYKLLGYNLGWATIAIAIIIRIALYPSSKKQLESIAKMAQLQPELKKLQKKYKNNQEKLAKEQMKLYKKIGYNPLGCLGSMVPQFIILIAIIQVIRVVTANDVTGIYPVVQEFVFGNTTPQISTTFFTLDLAQSYTAVAKEVGYFSISAIPYLIITIFVAVFQYYSTILMQKSKQSSNNIEKQKKIDATMSPEEMQEKMMQYTNFLFPLLTAFTTLTVPIVLGLYWMIQSGILVLQTILINKYKEKKEVKKLKTK